MRGSPLKETPNHAPRSPKSLPRRPRQTDDIMTASKPLTREAATAALRAARIAGHKAKWHFEALKQLTLARDVAADSGLSLADMEQVEFEADIVALGREQAEREHRHGRLQERYAQVATEIWRQRIRSRKDIRPSLSKAEKAGGRIEPRRMRTDGVAMCGPVHMDATVFTAIVHCLETALGWPHKV